MDSYTVGQLPYAHCTLSASSAEAPLQQADVADCNWCVQDGTLGRAKPWSKAPCSATQDSLNSVDRLGGQCTALCGRLAAAVPSGAMNRDFARRFLAAHAVMEALRSSLLAMRALIQGFMSSFCQQARRARASTARRCGPGPLPGKLLTGRRPPCTPCLCCCAAHSQPPRHTLRNSLVLCCLHLVSL